MIDKRLKWIFIIFLLVSFSIIGVINFHYMFGLGEPLNIVPAANNIEVSDNVFEINLVNADLETYNDITGKLSSRVRVVILKAMEKNCKKYNLPIGLLHGIFRTESEYRFYLDHTKININVHGKSLSTNAIGIGGVVWEFWEDKLRSNGIAETKTDLYLPEINIEASCYILRSIINEELKNSNQYNIIPRIITRYYGAYSEGYLSKMQKVTSDLWMNRMGQILISQGNTSKMDSSVHSTSGNKTWTSFHYGKNTN